MSEVDRLQRILVPLDGGERAASVLQELEPFRQAGSQLELFLVLEAGSSQRTEAEAYLQQEASRLEALGWPKPSSALAEGDPAEEILRQIESSQPDLVALASHGRVGPWRWLRGSVAERVLRHCSRPLLVTHGPVEGEEAHLRPERILVPLDGSERATQILPLAISAARAFGAELVLLRASDAHHLSLAEFLTPVEERAPVPTTDEQLEQDLLPAKALVEEAGVPVRLLTAFGDPANEILRSAEEEQIDLIALTTHGRTGWNRWVFGSVAEKVLRAWPRTVLVLRNSSSS
jgi:nucleotide-binding universal stress UspA family protein